MELAFAPEVASVPVICKSISDISRKLIPARVPVKMVCCTESANAWLLFQMRPEKLPPRRKCAVKENIHLVLGHGTEPVCLLCQIFQP